MRPGLTIVDEAHEFESDITLEVPTGAANAKSIMEVTMLGIISGTEVTIKAEGSDEQEAVNVIANIIQSDFKEDVIEV